MTHEAGKGDGRRPGEGYGEGYERIWGKKLPPCNCLQYVCMTGTAFDPETCREATERANEKRDGEK